MSITNKDKKAFIDSIIENKEILTFTIRDMYESLKNIRNDFYEEVTTDEVLLHMIYDSNIPIANKRLLFMQLKSFTENEDIKAAIDTYITRSDTAYDYLNSNPDLVYTVYIGNKSSLNSLNNIRSNPGGIFDSFTNATEYIKYFNEKCIKDDPANEVFLNLQFHLLDATVLTRGDQYKSEKDNTACSCILDSNGELLQVFFDNFKPKDGTFPDIHPLFNKSYNAAHNFTIGDIVRPRWDTHNFNFLDNNNIYFVRRVKESSKILLDCYDRKNKVIYDIDQSVSPFSLSMEYRYMYEDDAYLFDFITKYQAYLKGGRDYTLLDVMNSFSDCNMKGNN